MSDATSENITPAAVETLAVRAVRRVSLKFVEDHLRGHLSVGNFEEGEIPFVPRRYFITYAIPSEEGVRGQHAHKECHQFLVCVNGSCEVRVDDGLNTATVKLSCPSEGLYVPPMIWAEETRHTSDACLLVFASHAYDPEDYIRDYDVFREAVFTADAGRTAQPESGKVQDAAALQR